MILNDIELLKKIFSLIDEGIHENYEKLVFEVDVFDNYTDESLTLTINGEEKSNCEVTYDTLELYYLIKNLKEESIQRGEDWKVLTLSYTPGGKVDAKYKYEHLEDNIL